MLYLFRRKKTNYGSVPIWDNSRERPDLFHAEIGQEIEQKMEFKESV